MTPGIELPGWKWIDLKKLNNTLEKYKNIDENKLLENLGYF